MAEVAEDAVAIQLTSLLDRASHGEVIVVTRDGRPLVRLEPATPAGSGIPTTELTMHRARQAMARMRAAATSLPEPRITIDEIVGSVREDRQR